MHQFLKKVDDFITCHVLLDYGKSYLATLSGGADSVALLLAVRHLNYSVEAVHCNFHLRGDESDRDEAFCKQLCDRLGVPLHLVHFDTKAYAELHHVSIEMAARELRYSYFERLRNDIGAEGILVAHHLDDSVETVLINLVRGTGLHGLTGISSRQGNIIRPLLGVSRDEVVGYLQDIGQDYVTDSSNLVPDVVRNKLRLNVIPLLGEINPSVKNSIDRTSRRLASAASLLDDIVSLTLENAKCESGSNGVEAYDIGKLDNEYLFFALLSPLGFNPVQCEAVFDNRKAKTGTIYKSPTHEVLFDRGKLLIQPSFTPPKPLRMPVDGKYVVSDSLRIRISEQAVDSDFEISRDPMRVCIDAAKVRFPLTLRTVAEGDRFTPFGMKGSKLLSDFLTDLKVNRFDKQRQLLVADADGRTVWVVGRRIDDHVKISTKTSKVLTLHLFEENV